VNPLVFEEVSDIRRAVSQARAAGARVGFVPTMGALHAGHASLIEAASRDCDFVTVSIFVNPTQFGPNEDLSKYPRPFAADVEVCRQAGAKLIFHPQPKTIYPSGFSTFVEVQGLSNLWEGAHRPGHFNGVTTVVLKLLNVVLPDVTYFGRKDFQQQLIIKRMCQDLDWPFAIITRPTLRDPDGMAMSSRNVYLSPSERQAGLSLSSALFHVRDQIQQGARDIPQLCHEMRDILGKTPGVIPDYATIIDSDTLAESAAYAPGLTAIIAARVGPTRLIDNVELP
jgi:pantoate--beta-alanine ligase